MTAKFYPKKIIDHAVSNEEFRLEKNTEFGYLQTKPFPDNLDKYYDSHNYISHTDSNEGLLNSLYQQAKKFMLSQKLALVEKHSTGKKLLDIGTGTGDFLTFAKNKGFQISGTEPNPKARKLATEKGLAIAKELSQFERGSFDCITLWHVLEHIPDPDRTLEELYSLLKDQSVVLIAVPNWKSWDAQFYKSFWAAYDVPRHLYHFDKNAIRTLAEKNNFRLKSIKSMPLDAFYVSILSEKYSNTRFAFMKGLLVGLCSNIKAIFNNEFSSHIYILEKQ